MKSYFIPLLSFLLLCSFNDISTVNQIWYSLPDDISSERLLIPCFDELDYDENSTAKEIAFAKKVNTQAQSSNKTLDKVIRENYPFSYMLVTLDDVEEYKAKGYKYYLDMVIMPKQMAEAKKEAMIPSFEKFATANKMYRNRNAQFHYYFYIRDLETHDAYMSGKMKGNPEVYTGMSKFFKQIAKEAR